MALEYVDSGNDDGVVFGRSSGKIAFFGRTTVTTQQAVVTTVDSTAVTTVDTTTITALTSGATLTAAITAVQRINVDSQLQAETINKLVADSAAQAVAINQLITKLRALGLFASS